MQTARGAARPPGRRDLTPTAGTRDRLHLWAGDVLVWGANLLRRPLILGVRLLAWDAQGRVFLVRHSYRPGWHLPGGGVDAGETARAAVLREAAEEGGLVLDRPPRLLNLYHHATTGRHDHVAVFLADNVRQAAGQDASGFEIRENGFFDVSALPEATSSATRARIAEALGQAPVSDQW